jgi:hypothetical protein
MIVARVFFVELSEVTKIKIKLHVPDSFLSFVNSLWLFKMIKNWVYQKLELQAVHL